MLFSHEETAEWLDARFETAWRTLRPVPLVTVDFADGRAVTRSLHGNVITWVCTPDGEIVDGLPGLYEPGTYREKLEEIADLASRVATLPATTRRATVAAYHNARSDRQARSRTKFLSKGILEGPMERSFAYGSPAPSAPPSPADALLADTRANEKERRPALHTLLLDAGPSRPADVERRVYREILHADLDDPWLGLGEALFDPGDPRRIAAKR